MKRDEGCQGVERSLPSFRRAEVKRKTTTDGWTDLRKVIRAEILCVVSMSTASKRFEINNFLEMLKTLPLDYISILLLKRLMWRSPSHQRTSKCNIFDFLSWGFNWNWFWVIEKSSLPTCFSLALHLKNFEWRIFKSCWMVESIFFLFLNLDLLRFPQ